MVLIFGAVFFAGLAFMFYRIISTQDEILKSMRQDHARLEERLQHLEIQLASPPATEPQPLSPSLQTESMTLLPPNPEPRPLSSSPHGLDLTMDSHPGPKTASHTENSMPELKL